MRALLAIAGVLLGTALIAALALSGHVPGEGGLVRFTPAGIIEKLPSRANQIELRAHGAIFRLTRTASKHWVDADRPDASGQEVLNRRVAAALRFLEVTAPSRVIDKAQYGTAALAQFGLAPERYRVTLFVDGKAACTIDFGSLNPSKTSQYVRVVGRDKLYLTPLHLGRQWEAVEASAAQAAAPSSASPEPGREGQPASRAGQPANAGSAQR